jgi:SAM-dependent methyltransferase
MTRLLFHLVKLAARLLPASWVESLTLSAINAKADALPPAEGLRLLLRLDNRLYEGQSRLALRHEGGHHPKHRITRYHEFFVERIGEGWRVLDVGCGQGALAFSLAERSGAWVTGVDMSSENIAKAKARFEHPRLVFAQGNALEALPGGPFDAVVLSNVLEHLPGRADFLKGLVAATGARKLLLRVPLIERDWRVPLKKELGVEWRADPTHEIEYTLAEFEAELAEGGLLIDEMQLRWGEAWAVTRPAEVN